MKITVVGMGPLGVVAASGLAGEGHRVVGVDVDETRITELKTGKTVLHEPGLEAWLAAGLQSGHLSFFHTQDFHGDLGDAVVIATGTPASEGGEADLGQVRSALHWLRAMQPRNATIVMKSTVPPGSGRTFTQQELSGLDVAYVSNPEFLREGRALHDWKHPDRIVVGMDGCSRSVVETVKQMYRGIEAPYLVTDTTSAEMLKYASNAFLATRISFINEIAALCEKVGASIDAVSRGLALDARTGKQVHAGIGYGGSCLPKDILALQYLAQTERISLDLLGSVASVNARQRLLPLARLRSVFTRGLAGVNVGVLGLSFKPGTNDIREAASLDIVETLVAEGAVVSAYDPQANEAGRKALPTGVAFCDCPESAARDAQALLLLTEWDEIVEADWAAIAQLMREPRFVFDGRNALDARNMLKLGFKYTAIGRGNLDQQPQEDVGMSHQPAAPWRVQ